MYFVIYDTVRLFQNYSVYEYETEEEAFKKLDEGSRLHGWKGWVSKEVERPATSWLEYPKNKPDDDLDPVWYMVMLENGTVSQACWWGNTWYCFPLWNMVVKYRSNTPDNKDVLSDIGIVNS